MLSEESALSLDFISHVDKSILDFGQHIALNQYFSPTCGAADTYVAFQLSRHFLKSLVRAFESLHDGGGLSGASLFLYQDMHGSFLHCL